METNNRNNFNTNAMFPNIDQLSGSARDIYLKDHEFQKETSRMIKTLEKMIAESGTEEGESSPINDAMAKVSGALNEQDGVIQDIKGSVTKFIDQIKDNIKDVESAYENLYTNILKDIKFLNINTDNRTAVFDSTEAYKDRLGYKIDKLIGKKSPYKDGRSKPGVRDKYTIVSSGTQLELRDTDIGLNYKSFPVIINPNRRAEPTKEGEEGESITQEIPIKLFEFDAIPNGTDMPSFLAEVYISGDLFSYKGLISSGPKDKTVRGVNFDAEYLINQELPFSFKILKEEDSNKIVVAFKFDETPNKFASIVKFDCSVNLLVGKNLQYAEPETIMTYNRPISQ